jgi:hypothetical protein
MPRPDGSAPDGSAAGREAPDIEAVAEQVFVALADPSRRAILAALASGGPEAGLVTAAPGERRRVRYRLHSAPMQVAQQFLAALARDWDRRLGALTDHLDQQAGGAA